MSRESSLQKISIAVIRIGLTATILQAAGNNSYSLPPINVFPMDEATATACAETKKTDSYRQTCCVTRLTILSDHVLETV